jgi:hypothetical protein
MHFNNIFAAASLLVLGAEAARIKLPASKRDPAPAPLPSDSSSNDDYQFRTFTEINCENNHQVTWRLTAGDVGVCKNFATGDQATIVASLLVKDLPVGCQSECHLPIFRHYDFIYADLDSQYKRTPVSTARALKASTWIPTAGASQTMTACNLSSFFAARTK